MGSLCSFINTLISNYFIFRWANTEMNKMTDQYIQASKLLSLKLHSELEPLYENGGDYILADDLRAIIEEHKRESGEAVGYEPSKTQLQSIVDGLGRCFNKQAKKDFLRVWIRDWTAHKLNAAPPQPDIVAELVKALETANTFISDGLESEGALEAEHSIYAKQLHAANVVLLAKAKEMMG